MKRVLIGLLLLWAAPLSAREEILSFHSDIAVQQDGTMTVTETIAVRAENVQIKRGIFRDFPTRYKDVQGKRYSVGFDVTGVTRDGEDEPYHLKPLANGKRVYIGRESHTLKPDTYTYALTYTTDRQLGYFKRHDELYWNVTGTDWAFPILRATARVVLPDSIPVDSLKHEAYTGPKGARGRDYRVTISDDGHVHFECTRPLAAGEGLTLVVGWEKGHVHEPSAVERVQLHLRDNPLIFVATIGAFALFMFCFIVWVIVGRDPAKGTIIPLFKPPEGVSPAAARFVMNMGYDSKCFPQGASVDDQERHGRTRVRAGEGI